ncbi:hypothetical protein [Streptomyces sasae]|uniref:hypothetical protein n=1 Tax=Streptomyces sasae TaxID=1266772 RepID=UPI003741F38D
MAAGVQLPTCDLSRLRHLLDEYRSAIRDHAYSHPEPGHEIRGVPRRAPRAGRRWAGPPAARVGWP